MCNYKASGGSIVYTFQKDTISFVGKESRNKNIYKIDNNHIC